MNLKKQLTYIHLPDIETFGALNEYKQLLLSLINKKVLSLTTVDGNTEYLCNSSLEEILLKNEILSIINSTVIKLPYFSVYAGIIISSMLMKLWSEAIQNFGLLKMTESLIEFKDILEEALNSLKYPSVNVLSIASLQHSLIMLLLQEPALMLSTVSLNKFSFEIVKGVFAKVCADQGFNIGDIYILVRNGPEYFSLIDGVVCEVDDTTRNLIESIIPKLSIQNKMLLFTENICESDRFMLILNEILHNDIKLIMCQKKISNSLKVIFRRNNIIAVERIGLEVAKSMEQITSCVPVCNINDLEVNSTLSYAGCFSSFNIQNLNGLNYIVIEKKGCSVSTLYVSCRSFSSSSCIKKLCFHCIKFVRTMISTPHLLPGPITFEEKLINYFKNKIVDDDLLNEIISVFGGILNEIKISYKDSKGEDCSCQEIESQTSWDCYHVKKNALIYSIEGVINCLNIGMIVRM